MESLLSARARIPPGAQLEERGRQQRPVGDEHFAPRVLYLLPREVAVLLKVAQVLEEAAQPIQCRLGFEIRRGTGGMLASEHDAKRAWIIRSEVHVPCNASIR